MFPVRLEPEGMSAVDLLENESPVGVVDPAGFLFFAASESERFGYLLKFC